MNQTSASSRLVDVSEAADRLGLSTLTLYKWVSARRIGHVKLGRAIRISEDEIRRLVDVGSRPARRER